MMSLHDQWRLATQRRGSGCQAHCLLLHVCSRVQALEQPPPGGVGGVLPLAGCRNPRVPAWN